MNGILHVQERRKGVAISMATEEDIINDTGPSKYSLRDKHSNALSLPNRFLDKVKETLATHKTNLTVALKVGIALLYYGYFGYAVSVQFGDEGSWRLTVCTILGTLLIAWRMLKKTKWRSKFSKCSLDHFLNQKPRTVLKWGFYFVALILMVAYLAIYVIRQHPWNLISLVGMAVFLLGLYVSSTNRYKVRWHTVYWGMTLQFAFAVVLLKTTWGVAAMEWISERLTEFTAYANDGSQFLVGDAYKTMRVLFKSMPEVVVFVVMINTLTYLGVTAFLIRNVGGALSFLLDTNPVESVVAAANSFLGANECMMLIKDNIPDMSTSQLFCVLVSGFSSVSGSVMIAMTAFGIPIQHLISASVLSAPAALATAKLNMPEENEERSEDKKKLKISVDKGGANNVLESISLSVMMAANLVKSIVFNMLVFIALASFIDATFTWFGERIDVPDLTFKKICSYVLWPIPYLMGISPEYCKVIAEKIAIRTITNAGIAYIDIGALHRNRMTYLQYSDMHNDTVFRSDGDVFLPAWNQTLTAGFLDRRTEIISIYAICGFASIPSLGMNLGVIGAIAPKRLKECSRIMTRAFCVSTIASFLTACMAGLLYSDD